MREAALVVEMLGFDDGHGALAVMGHDLVSICLAGARSSEPGRLVRLPGVDGALNQLLRTAPVELVRRCPQAVCVALHPGTVATGLGAPIVGERATVFEPAVTARYSLDVIEGLTLAGSGRFFCWRGEAVPW